MRDDPDPILQRRFEREFEQLPVPSFRRRSRSTRSLVPGVAVVALAIALFVGGLVISDLRGLRAAGGVAGYNNGVCRPTDVTSLPASGGAYPGFYKVMIGGDLAGMPYDNLGNGDSWNIRATQPARAAIHLRADRLDKPSEPVVYTAVAYPLAAGLPADWAAPSYYRTTIDAPDALAAGCWKVTWLEGSSADAVVYSIKNPNGITTSLTPRVEQASSVLVITLGAGSDQPGVSPALPGGVTPTGPSSFAVDSTSIYIWDQAGQRVLIYELRPTGSVRAAPRVVALPEVPSRATGLLVDASGDWYLRESRDDGTVLVRYRIQFTPGVSVSSSRTDLSYPRTRPTRSIIGQAKGAIEDLGADAFGNRYEREMILSGVSIDQSVEIRRVRQLDGVTVAVVRRPAASPVDMYVADNGGVYELRWNDGPLVRSEVTQLLAPLTR